MLVQCQVKFGIHKHESIFFLVNQLSLVTTNLNATIFTKFPMDHWEDNVNIGGKMLRKVR